MVLLVGSLVVLMRQKAGFPCELRSIAIILIKTTAYLNHMQITFAYAGQPQVSLIVDIPKLKGEVLPPKIIWQARRDLQVIMSHISEESKLSPESFATQLFKTVKSEYQSLVLLAMVFTIEHENEGRTVLTYTPKEIRF